MNVFYESLPQIDNEHVSGLPYTSTDAGCLILDTGHKVKHQHDPFSIYMTEESDSFSRYQETGIKYLFFAMFVTI